MKNLQLKHLPLIAFLLYFIKISIVSPSVQEMGVMAILAACAFLYEFKSQNKQVDELTQKIQELNTKLDTSIDDQNKKIEENRQFVASMKMGTAMKGANGWGPNR